MPQQNLNQQSRLIKHTAQGASFEYPAATFSHAMVSLGEKGGVGAIYMC
ncbi:MAG: hypothetical protein R3E79_50015 [Caldilineaceae bacterium]